MTLQRGWLRRLLWIYCFLVFSIKPLSAQTIPPDFRAWFFQQVAGKPFGQQTLLELAPQLPCVGSALTPPNASGERTKIWDPKRQEWIRVGFGEGQWVYVTTTPGLPPVITSADLASCGTNPPPTHTPNTVDIAPLLARLDVIYAQLYAQDERIFQNLSTQIGEVRLQLQAHDAKPSDVERILGNRYVQLFLAAAGSWLATHQVMK